MKFFYDRKSDSLYLGLSERNEYRDSVEAAPGVVLDFDEAGRLLGIDLEHASRLVDVSDLELHEEPAEGDAETARLDGGKLRKERERIGLSQIEIARRLSVSPNTVARWERGELKIEHPGMLQLALKSLRTASGSAQTRVMGSVVRKGTAPYAKSIGRSAGAGSPRETSAPVKTSTRTKTSTAKKKRGLSSR
jgi:DNA-binding transcriptional regulator YiaG